MLPLVSVIVTTKNEEKNIAACLKSILAQTYKNIEVIVVDNNSTDKTKEIIQKDFQTLVLKTVRLYSYGPERSAQRNFGVAKSKGIYVLYVDADMKLSPKLIESCVQYMQTHSCIALHISEIVMGQGYWGKVRAFERSFYDGTVIDGARFIKREIFKKVGGFDESLSGPEDWDIDKKLKKLGKIALLPNANNKVVIYHNETQFQIFKYANKKKYYSKSFAAYINKWGSDDPDIKKQFGLLYRYFGVFMEKGKWKKLILHPHLAFGMYFLRIIIGLQFIFNGK
jgi:glycosyltransferase involved in cell wall biosynthesis